MTVRGLTAFGFGALALVPISDLLPLPLGLIWRTAAEDAKIRALAELARREGPWATDGRRPGTVTAPGPDNELRSLDSAEVPDRN